MASPKRAADATECDGGANKAQKVKEKTQLKLDPIERLSGTVVLPGSKSLSNRALLLSALSKGTTTVENLLDSDDIRAMLGALKRLGVKIDETARLSDNRVVIVGNAGRFDLSSEEGVCELSLGNAGTAMRPLASVVCACKGKFVLDGTPRMRERPIKDLIDGLRQLGSPVECTDNPPHGGCPPVRVEANGLQGGSCVVSGKISSQYLSALLMTAPLAESGSVTIEISDELVSKPYVDMTVGLMRKFGVRVEEEELSSDKTCPRPRYTVPGGQAYVSPGTYHVEGDASGASYFLAGGAITGGPVTVSGCGSESVQGDVKFANVREKMGATVEWQPNSITVSRRMDGTQRLKGVDVDCGEIPDAAMTLSVLGLFAQDEQPTAIRNVYNWRVKETERMKAIVTELRKLGGEVEEGRDYCVVKPLGRIKSGVDIDTYDDHRMAMVFSLAACGGEAVTINDPACTAKTFPTFFDELRKLFVPK
jgi:3-phosphoshikimate 1-carboxyvinyltransferase